jgi:hypothetical protein
MSKPAILRQADIKRLARIAKQDGVVIEVERFGIVIRVSADRGQNKPIELEDIRL